MPSLSNFNGPFRASGKASETQVSLVNVKSLQLNGHHRFIMLDDDQAKPHAHTHMAQICDKKRTNHVTYGSE